MVIEIKTDKPYEVIVEDGVLDRAGEKIAPLVRPGSRAMIVSETNVFPIYGERLKASLEKAGIHTAEFVFEAGEPPKATFHRHADLRSACGKRFHAQRYHCHARRRRSGRYGWLRGGNVPARH